jgi:hypothetical protein
LKLTGKNVVGSIVFPDATMQERECFLQANTNISKEKQKEIILNLALEAHNSRNLKIEVSGKYTL